MTFRPINDDHAVERCDFAVGLNAPLSPRDTNLLHSNSSNWAEELPSTSVAEAEPNTDSTAQLVLGPNNVGLQFSYLRPDGSAVWSMQCAFNEILVSCTRYTRWVSTWEVAKSLLTKVLSVLRESQNAKQVISVGLRVKDEFYAPVDGNVATALVASRFLTGHALIHPSAWHNNLGWFDTLDSSPVLNHLNISTRNELSKEGLRRHLQLVHLQQIRLEDIDRSPPLAKEEDFVATVGSIEKQMTELHLRNKKTMKELLHPNLAARIGLGGMP
jgi:uncharacterized protein (TIGR04255 family)